MMGRGHLALSGLALLGAVAVRASVPVEIQEAVILEDRLPRALSEFGFFADPALQAPAPGVIPFRLNTPLYSDGAEKLRFIYVPERMKLRADGEGLLQFPVGTALIKTFAFGEGDARMLIETRVMLHRADGWVALPYQWNEEQSDARLVVAGGRVPITTPSGEEISYRIPNKNQCKECHGLDGEVIPLGPKARNLAHDWLESMVALSKLDRVPEVHDTMPVWEGRESADLNLAARAYLDVNCAHCHRPGATASNSGLDLRWEQDNPEAIGIMKRPVAAGRGAGGLQFSIVPGDPESSILLYRLNSTEPGVAMPELGKGTIDREGVSIVQRWIEEMNK